MSALAALALGVTIGGSAYDDAFARGQRSMADPAERSFYKTVLLPQIQGDLGRVVLHCAQQMKHGDDMATVIVVIDYTAGAASQIFLDKDTPVGRCVADGIAAIAFPAAPIPDFAEVQGFHIRP